MTSVKDAPEPSRFGRIHDWDPRTSGAEAAVARGFSADFRHFLAERDADGFEFADPDRAAHGGRSDPKEPIRRDPVILVHGNSDSADGFAGVIEELRRRGYRDCEVYALSWGRSAAPCEAMPDATCSALLGREPVAVPVRVDRAFDQLAPPANLATRWPLVVNARGAVVVCMLRVFDVTQRVATLF